MSDDTRAVLDELLLRRLTWRDRWVAIYFALSLAAIIITAEAPIWVMIAMMLNFFNAVGPSKRSVQRGMGKKAER